jgi:hypothetical protein
MRVSDRVDTRVEAMEAMEAMEPVEKAPPTAAEYQETSAGGTAIVAPDALRCAHCGRPVDQPSHRRGSPRRFCRPACREAARLRRERGLPEDRPREPNRHGRRRIEVSA